MTDYDHPDELRDDLRDEEDVVHTVAVALAERDEWRELGEYHYYLAVSACLKAGVIDETWAPGSPPYFDVDGAFEDVGDKLSDEQISQIAIKPGGEKLDEYKPDE